MEKEQSLKEIVVNIMRKKKGYTSDLGGFYFLAEDFFSAAAEEIVAELKEALNPTSDSKREPEGFTDEQIRTLIKKLKEE